MNVREANKLRKWKQTEEKKTFFKKNPKEEIASMKSQQEGIKKGHAENKKELLEIKET